MLIAARVAPVTRHIGLVPSVVVTHTEPFHASKAIATLDYVSPGRAGVRIRVSSSPHEAALFGRRDVPRLNLRDRDDPAVREFTAGLIAEAADYVEVMRRLWDSWEDDAEIRDAATGRFIDRDKLHYIDFAGDCFSVKGPSITPRPPQGQPVVSALGHGPVPCGLIGGSAKGRLARYGRSPDQLLILPAATFVLGDTDADARELAREVRFQQVSGQTAIMFLEQLWNRDLSGYDPDGPLPGIDPEPGENTIARGRASVRMYRDPLTVAAQWRARAEAGNLSIRELIIEVTGRQTFVGAPATVAGAISTLVQADAGDGFILVPHITPGGLDDFADRVVPLLQERGVFRADYKGSTLREHLGLAPLPAGAAS